MKSRKESRNRDAKREERKRKEKSREMPREEVCRVEQRRRCNPWRARETSQGNEQEAACCRTAAGQRCYATQTPALRPPGTKPSGNVDDDDDHNEEDMPTRVDRNRLTMIDE